MELSIAQHVFSNYFDAAQVIDYSVINNWLINKTYKLDTSQGTYILQEINQNVINEPELAFENIKSVSSWLKEYESNYAFPTPIHFTYKFFFDKLWRLLPYINATSYNEIKNKKMVSNATVCIADFYRILDQFPVQDLNITIPHFHHGQYYIDEFHKALNHCSLERKTHATQEINHIKPALDELAFFDEVVRQLPNRLVHFDTKISNLLFDEDLYVKALIDLDTLMPGSILSNVGDMIRTYSNKLGEESTDFDRIQADSETIETIVDSILQHTQLTDLEKTTYFCGESYHINAKYSFFNRLFKRRCLLCRQLSIS